MLLWWKHLSALVDCACARWPNPARLLAAQPCTLAYDSVWTPPLPSPPCFTPCPHNPADHGYPSDQGANLTRILRSILYRYVRVCPPSALWSIFYWLTYSIGCPCWWKRRWEDEDSWWISERYNFLLLPILVQNMSFCKLHIVNLITKFVLLVVSNNICSSLLRRTILHIFSVCKDVKFLTLPSKKLSTSL